MVSSGVGCHDTQLDTLKVQGLKGVSQSESGGFSADAPVLTVSFAEYDAEMRQTARPVDVAEMHETDKSPVGKVLDGEAGPTLPLFVEDTVVPAFLHLFGDGKSVAKNGITYLC